MRYFYLEPEVSGGPGDNSVMDTSVHPPIVTRLHYEFDGWLGDAMVTSFPCYLVTEGVERKILESRFSGVTFDKVEVTTSELFEEMQPDQKLPPFVWLKVSGKAGLDDFGIAKDYRLVVSESVLDVLKLLGVSNALIEPFEGS
ncbi:MULTISPECIES: hypothetical protein [unclassified Mesorhizobium]|uniref:hypothetical protein n=1 Tax=unclassified Mesorhizobium TaxID=325217 RepID=UPI0004CF5424|nr:MULTISPECIES: hypothetical protein [unclassified Mesorhizobium]WJI76001.1 hypothetical protein NLY37_04610 [Mesorhizobium sp. C395A]